MTTQIRRSTLAVAVGGIVAVGAAQHSHAQPAAQSGEVEEIVVTARRRFETFQDAPVTITVFNEAEIERAGIDRPQDFIALTPNVTLVQTQNQGTSFVTVRGISQARNSEPSVAVLVDGVLMSNPSQFNQELFDVQQIEVLKGAQGAVYGRNAIGGAMVITTREPGDQFRGRVRVGADSGIGHRFQLSGSGPLGNMENLRYHAALNYYDTEGFIFNPYLQENADPFKDRSIRTRLIWDASDRLTTDARFFQSKVNTQALYFNIVDDVNDTSLPVRVNNAGQNDRDLTQVAFKVDYHGDFGTFTSVTSYDTIEEILTGDQFDFLPIEESLFYFLGAVLELPFPFGEWDWAQHQFLDVNTWSQEFRFTSRDDSRVRWIAGTYMIATDRYISTGNIADMGAGAFPVRRTPRSAAQHPDSFQLTFLADEQDNFAWAVFADLGFDLSERLELNLAARYDRDTRENTTLTPNEWLGAIPDASFGEVRKNTWSELQPKLTLRYQPSSRTTVYGGWSRGFRSGGFNQTGVGAEAAAAGIAGVGDLFGAEVADTAEFGIKYLSDNGRFGANFSVFDTRAEGSYFFVFLPDSSTQNLGSLDETRFQGFEIDIAARLMEGLRLNVGYGYTDSEIRRFDGDPSQVGNRAPLVSRDTTNVGLQYRTPLGQSGVGLLLRSDYQRIGRTWWEPANMTVRDPVNLLDLRIGIEADDWSIVAWQRNSNNTRYNAEFSPGGFVFKGMPRRYGVDFTKHF